MRLTGYQLNTYFSLLAVTIIGSGAALIIMHVANADAASTALGNEAPYQHLQQSILGS